MELGEAETTAASAGSGTTGIIGMVRRPEAGKRRRQRNRVRVWRRELGERGESRGLEGGASYPRRGGEAREQGDDTAAMARQCRHCGDREDANFADNPLGSNCFLFEFLFNSCDLARFNWGTESFSKNLKIIRVAPNEIMKLTIFCFEFLKGLTWFQNSKLICNYLKSSFFIEAFKPFYKICKNSCSLPMTCKSCTKFGVAK